MTSRRGESNGQETRRGGWMFISAFYLMFCVVSFVSRPYRLRLIPASFLLASSPFTACFLPRVFTLVVLMVGGGLWVAVSDAFVGYLIGSGRIGCCIAGRKWNVGSDCEMVFSFVYNSNLFIS